MSHIVSFLGGGIIVFVVLAATMVAPSDLVAHHAAHYGFNVNGKTRLFWNDDNSAVLLP